MTKFLHLESVLTTATCLCLIFGQSLAQTQPPSANQAQKETTVSHHATGPFEVKLTPQDDKSEDAGLGRVTLDKQFHGDIEATSKGQMLTAAGSVKGSGAYVAIEKVSGTLQGRTGTFVLQHTGTMTGGTPRLSITVVPDSGTGQLAGIAGTMTIKIADGKHSYEFDYTLSENH